MNTTEDKNLRENIRRLIRHVKAKKAVEENKLRAVIREMIHQESRLMEKITIGSIEPPSDSTGLNKLDSVLNTIVPRVEQFYKELTTDPEQRKSFRAHYLRSIMKELVPVELNQDAAELAHAEQDAEEGLNEIEIVDENSVNVDILDDEGAPDMSKFRELDKEAIKDKEDAEELSAEEQFSKDLGLEDEEKTGRDFGLDAWEATKGVVIPVYAKLHNEEDSELFYDYLITNMKIWFNIFDGQLESEVAEPESTVDYETPAGAQEDPGTTTDDEVDELPDEGPPELDFGMAAE